MTHMTKSTRAMLLGAALLVGGCQSYDILNTNFPTVETLTGTPSRAALARAATGIFSQTNIDLAGRIQQWGIYGREGYNLLGNDPRETGEEIRGPQDPQGRAGGVWALSYQAVRTINAYLAALPNGTGITEAEVSADATLIVTTPSGRNPRSTRRSAPRLRTVRPAEMRRIVATATCETTST